MPSTPSSPNLLDLRARRLQEEPRAGAPVLRCLRNLSNLVVRNDPALWERMYRAGQWDFLGSPTQQLRHLAIARILRERFPDGAAVLDVGCGPGLLFPLLDGPQHSYTGLDVAPTAIATSRGRCDGDARSSFECVAFEDFRTERRFDAVVLSEVLYYFPLRSVGTVFRRAFELLDSPYGIVIVSMNRNLKARWIRRRLARLAAADQIVRVRTGAHTQARWIVAVYGAGTGVKTPGVTLLQQEPAICGGENA